jgi:hypothetical protein
VELKPDDGTFLAHLQAQGAFNDLKVYSFKLPLKSYLWIVFQGKALSAAASVRINRV